MGRGEIGGRPTYVFERHLPYTGDEADYPDRLLVFHIDGQYLVPTGCYCYADEAEQALLGSYLYTDIQLNQATPTTTLTRTNWISDRYSQ